jgi:hypothetical protein
MKLTVWCVIINAWVAATPILVWIVKDSIEPKIKMETVFVILDFLIMEYTLIVYLVKKNVFLAIQLPLIVLNVTKKIPIAKIISQTVTVY